MRHILLIGPTAVGKTDIAIYLTNIFPIELISVDSSQLYRELNIGTAKPSFKHHLIDIINPDETYSVAKFINDVETVLSEIYSRNNIPLFVGGSMLYVYSLLNGLTYLPESNPEIRKRLTKEFLSYGNQLMHKQLESIDPISAKSIHYNDTHRIMRALEICLITNKQMSSILTEKKSPLIKNYLLISLMPENRDILYKTIDNRFLLMLQNGLVDEVIQLKNKYNLTLEHNSMRSTGYKQALNYINGQYGYNELIVQGKTATRNLAKRQITWMKKMKSYQLYTTDSVLSSVVDLINNYL